MNTTRFNLGRPLLALLVLLPAIAAAQGAQYTFFGVGDLAGGIVQSEVRDTTRVGSVVYAVGGSAATAGSLGNDTAFLWTSTGGMTPLPPLVAYIKQELARPIGGGWREDDAACMTIIRELERRWGGRYRKTSENGGKHYLRLASINASSTISMRGALANWVEGARKRLVEQGADA